MPIKLADVRKANEEKEKQEIAKKYNVVGGLKLSKSSSNVTNESKPWYRDFVKKSDLFSDGYDFGDITKTTLNTATNIGANLLKGVANIGDAGAKLIVSGIATGADWLGYDNYADELRNRLAGNDEVVNERLKKYTPSGLFQKASDATKGDSIVGDTTQNVAEGVGYYGGMLAGQSVGIPWQVTSGVSSVGNELPEAYAHGATNAQAWLSAGISAGAEIGSEYIFGGIKLPGTGKTAETILNKVTNKIENKALKYLIQAGVNIFGEGAEEVISGYGSAIGKRLTYMNDKELKEIYSNEDKLQDFVMGTLVSAVSVGANPATYQNIKTGRSLINGLTLEEEEKLANSKVNNENSINNNQNSSLNNQLNQNERDNLKSNISSINNLIQTNNENLFNYNETNNQKINNLYQSAKESRLNNSQETQQLIDTISKVIEDKNYNILLDNTITNDNGNSVNAKITTNDNNEVEIRINPDSDRAGEFLLVHEISHAIKTPEMIQLVNDFASRNEGFARAVKEIETTYGKNLTSEEVFADVCGQLFGNQEFINALETQNTEQSKSLIRQIYEAIKKLLNRLTVEGRYRNFVQDLEVRWRNAYRNTTMQQSINSLNNQTNYMMTSINGMNNSVRVNNKYLDIKDRFIVANDMYNNSYSNEEIRQQTGWFKNTEGNWEFEISDYNTKFKILPKENGKYTLSELFEAKTLYDMYPELKDVSVEFKKIKSNGNFNAEKKKITIKNTLLNNLDNTKGTLLHEIQHYIQEYEGLPSGTTILFGNEQYANSLGEIEASDTKNRRNLDVSERKRIVPESAKETPTHPNRNNILNRKRNLVEKTVEKIYNKFGGTQNEASEEIDIQDNKSTDEKINRTYSEDKNGIRELDNSSFSLSQRVSGDKLLDAQDLIEEIKSVGANVDEKGYVTLYHQTTFENAEKIRQSGKMYAKEPYVYFSTSKNASQADGRGNVKLEFKIPAEKLELDDIFSDNADVKIKLNGNKELNVSNYIVNEKKIKNVSSIEQDVDKYLMPEIYNRYKNEDKTKINETIEELKAYKETLKPDENDEDWNKNFLANQKIKALENGFDNVYDNLINQDRERLLKEYKSVPENIEKQINKIKSKETKAQELKKDYKNATSRQQAQFDIIQKTNPAPEESNYVWIKKPSDIKTFEEIINDEESFTWGDYSKEDALRDLKKGTVTIYSSYAIKNGTFVSTSYQQALDYAGGDPTKVHHRTVALDSVAWINGDEGQYAKISTKYSQNNSLWQAHLEKNYKSNGTRTYFDDVKLKGNEMLKSNVRYSENLNNNKSDDVLKIIIDSKTQKELNKLDSELANIKERYTKLYPNDKKQRDSKIKSRAMEIATKKRNLIQGDWLIPIEKGLTANELSNRINKLKSNYVGKEVIVNDNKGKIIGTSFGKIGVELEDGTTKYYDASDIKPVQNIDSIIKKQTKEYNQIISNSKINIKSKLDPIEISNLNENDVTTTPKLQEKTYETGDGESHYWSNIKDKTNMLNDSQKEHILSNDEVKYYKKITNEETLNEAFKKLNKGGASETLRWINMDSKDATATDVAEGWILLKQYGDSNDYNSMVEVAKKMRNIGTKAGQTVQAFNIMARMSPEGMVKYAQSELSEAYEKMVKGKTKEWIDKYKNDFDLKPNEVQFIMDTMQEVKDMPDGYDKKVKLAEIQKMMTDKMPPDKDGRIKSWMRISMLFNPKTQVRNVAGNAIIAPVNYIGDIFASRMDKKIAKKTGVRTTGNMNIKAILEGMKKGAYQATNDYKKGINTKDMDGNRFEISSRKSFSDKNLIGKSLNRTEALLNYVMDAGDRVFSEASFENSLQNQMILNNTTEVTQEMIDIAHEEALSRTWNDNNNYTKFVLGVRSGLNNIKLGGYGLGDVLIPFAKTPANLTKAIVDYSPVGLVNSLTKYKTMKNAMETGQFNAKMQHDFVQTLGKATAGTMLYVLGMALAKAGITSGKSDDDKDTRDFIKNTLGINSYSIKIGNKSFTYDWAQPIAAPLSIMANIETSKKNKEQALLEGVVNSLDTAGSILLEQSFLSSINDVLSDNDGVVSGIINEVLELPSRAIPTFSKQIVDLTDSTQRQTYEYGQPLQTATNKIKAKLPGLSKTLSPSVDTMGREILRYGGKNNIFNVFLNPANVNTENISESASEIYRVYKVTGDQTIMPRVTPYYINQKGEKTILSTKERTEYAKVSGKIIEDNIKLLLKNSNYVKLEDEEKSQIIKNIVDYSYNKAREDVVGIEMSNTYNGVKTYTMAKGQISDYYLAKKAVSDVKDKYKGDTTAMKNARKQAIFNYINKLNISKAEKTILFGVTTNYSIKSYRAYLFNYINKLDITKKEKEEIWNKLYD